MSVNPRGLEVARAVRGVDTRGQHLAVAQQADRDLDASVARGPDTAPQPGEIRGVLAVNRKNGVAGMNIGLVRRPIRRDAGDHNAIVALCGIEAEPWPGGAVGPAVG